MAPFSSGWDISYSIIRPDILGTSGLSSLKPCRKRERKKEKWISEYLIKKEEGEFWCESFINLLQIVWTIIPKLVTFICIF